MTRLPLVQGDAPDPITAEVFQTSVSEGREPIALYRVLANNPVMLRSYAQLAKTLRYDAATPRALRELMILRIAQLCRSEYEWQHHRRMAADAGVTEEQVAALGSAASSPLFDEAQRLAIRLAEEQHEHAVTDATIAALRREVGDAATVELSLLGALYEGVARILQAFAVEVEDGHTLYAPVTDDGGG
jgi:4-carboxymuconolactone decarboxylase